MSPRRYGATIGPRLIHAPKLLFDLATDPRELYNIALLEPEKTARFVSQLDATLSPLELVAHNRRKARPNAPTVLQALGYAD